MIRDYLTLAELAFMADVERAYWPDLVRPNRECTSEPRCEPTVPCLHPLRDDE